MKLFQWYGAKLETAPLRVKTITAFCTLSLADLTCQVIEIKHSYNSTKKINLYRTLRLGVYCFIAAPWIHYYTTAILPKIFPYGTKLRLLKWVLFDSLIHMPVYITAIFSYLDLLSGKSLKQTYNEVKIKAKVLIQNLIGFRPWLMYINFCYVPMPWRVFYMNIFGFFTNTYMSWLQNVRLQKLLEEKIIQDTHHLSKEKLNQEVLKLTLQSNVKLNIVEELFAAFSL